MGIWKLVVICFCLINSAVCQKENKTSAKANIVTKIPKNTNGDFTSLYYELKAHNKLLNLAALNSGYDSIELRIWCKYGLLKKTHLIVISNQSRKWNGKLYTLTIDKKFDTAYSLENKTEKLIKPRSGWPHLVSQMNNLKIPTLVSCEYLDGYGSGVDTDYYMVEVATKNKYRFYYYFDPKRMAKKYKEADAFERFLSVLETEFDFKRP